MSAKRKVFLLALTTIIIVSTSVVVLNQNSSYRKGVSKKNDLAVPLAEKLYQKRVAEGIDLSSGPCLTDSLLPDWVADIVHDPRETIDDLSENQCAAFREGRVKHFVELDPKGNVVKVK